MSDYLEFDPSEIEPRAVYRLLTGSVVPRPIGWASTMDKDGRTNLAPFSFFTVVCVIPPMISLTIARNPDGSEKHTLKNIKETGEFCFNVVTEPVWQAMVDSANAIPEGESEFEATGLTPIPAVKVRPPRGQQAAAKARASAFGHRHQDRAERHMQNLPTVVFVKVNALQIVVSQ